MNPFEGYRITSPYGWRNHPVTGKRSFHTGIDLVKTHQAPIHAFVPGEVVHAKEGVAGSGFGNYGIVVAIRDPKTDHLHVYAHLDSAAVKVGQEVQRGQMIGRQGNTGQSTGSHLHYEIRKTSSPSFGWIEDRENNCFEPTQYLSEYLVKNREDEEPQEEPDLRDELEILKRQVEQLQARQSMDVPEWAQEAVAAAVEAGLVDTPDGGSYDFYRILTVMYRRGLIDGSGFFS